MIWGTSIEARRQGRDRYQHTPAKNTQKLINLYNLLKRRNKKFNSKLSLPDNLGINCTLEKYGRRSLIKNSKNIKL
jgi:hypothetical protein